MTRTWLRVNKVRLFIGIGRARMAELADAPDSKSGSRKRVGVRPSLWAPSVAAGRIIWVFYGYVKSAVYARINSKFTTIMPLDMSEWVAYSPRPRVMKELQPDICGSHLVVRHFTSFSNLTKEAAHA